MFLKVVDDPLNNGGPNDRRYYLWEQRADVPPPKCGTAPDLVTSGGRNGWNTQDDAQAVLDHELGQSAQLAANIKAANEKAVSPGNIAAGVAEDIKKDAEALAKNPYAWVLPVGLGIGAVIAWKVLR
jgi:hypothetical protein